MPATPSAFLVLDRELAPLRAGDPCHLAGEEGRHAAKVARIGVGERVLLTDLHGTQVLAEVEAAAKESLELRLCEPPRTAATRAPELVLVQALATGGRDEQAVESATELGADAVVPWIARRSVSVWRGEKQRKGRAKWEATVRAAVKQSRRARIPQVAEPLGTAQLVRCAAEWTAQGDLVLVLHEQESTGLPTLVPQMRAAGRIVLIVGPEGGIAPEEVAELQEAGARSVLLGPEVLRSSTAGPAAIAAISALIGRWG
ncbi:16S rRNA (uracil(1498)-N(3))-methyltransferase [Brachybacterium hainanense]|uniref:Ribosomal RNA small subunit methyltransferase E n=1 Tax=Brachybacterium hainanense TaxID=1541174 RepID=A0ABV6RE31_9MICO